MPSKAREGRAQDQSAADLDPKPVANARRLDGKRVSRLRSVRTRIALHGFSLLAASAAQTHTRLCKRQEGMLLTGVNLTLSR